MRYSILVRLREVRERRGWSQDEVGALSGYSRSMICKLEAGERRVSPAALVRLARALRVPVRELVGGESA
jgi:transcriptional regulator with XRE-family HTH domain